MPQHFYPLPVWSFRKIQENPPATQHSSVVQHTQKLVHPKDRTPRQKQSNVVYAVKYQREIRVLYIG